MNLRQLESFIAIAETGSLRAAAERLHLSPPSLSQQLRLLEGDVGGQVFERLPRGVRLTPAGRALLPDARAAVVAAQRGLRAARASLALETAEIEVATVLSLAVGVLPEAIQRMCDAYPGISVRLHEHPHRRALERAVEGGVGDVAIGPEPLGRRVAATSLGFEAFVAILPHRHPLLATPGSVLLAELAGERWVLFPPTHGLLEVVHGICQSAGFRPRDGIVTGQVEAAARLAAAGLGVAIVPGNIVPPHLAESARELDPPVRREIFAYARGALSPPAAALVEALRESSWPGPAPGALLIP